MNKALCTGINNYPGSANDLQGCVNDANDWANALKNFGFNVTTVIDAAVTTDNIKNLLLKMITEAESGDTLVFTYSGHGTNVPDTSGDEDDSYDEALYLYNGVLLDDELREIISKLPTGANLIVILDSCFSGTATRAIGVRPKYMPGSTPIVGSKKKAFLSGEDMVEILLSGCNDDEYSYDAIINNRANGAFTYYALKSLTDDITYEEWMNKIHDDLPSRNYPQTPQLEGSKNNTNATVFSKSDAPEVPNDNSICYWLLLVLGILAVIGVIVGLSL
jgi:hypothetical protein